jgi:hypothetical protein
VRAQPPSTRRAASDGVVGTVLAAMQTHPRNAKVQLAGCSAMWSLGTPSRLPHAVFFFWLAASLAW